MDDFRRHEVWCPRGAPPDGTTRLEMFPEAGDPPVPVWTPHGCYDAAQISGDLRADLRAWNDDSEQRQDDESSDDADQQWLESWLATGDELGRRLSSETGHTVIVMGPERLGRSPGCPHCSEAALRKAMQSGPMVDG